MIWLAVFLISGVCFLAVLAWTAPEGYEDENGWHAGRKMEDEI